MELDWSVDREGDASLVRVRVRNDATVPRRVRVESRLDGPLLPPRRGGVPETGWDAGGVTAVIDPGERDAFGFAALAEPVEPPVEIASVEPVPTDADGDRTAAGGSEDVALTAVRDLESHRPPRRAVAGGEADDRDGESRPDGAEATDADGDATARAGDDDADAGDRSGGGDANRSETADRSPSETDPDPIDAWFAAVEARIERAERLTDADLATATGVVEEAGGLDPVAELDERVAADAERLKAVRDRAAALAERAEEREVPTEALEGLA